MNLKHEMEFWGQMVDACREYLIELHCIMDPLSSRYEQYNQQVIDVEYTNALDQEVEALAMWTQKCDLLMHSLVF